MGANAVSTWASGYMGSFQSWSYAKSAFDKWSMQVAQRFAALAWRGIRQVIVPYPFGWTSAG